MSLLSEFEYLRYSSTLVSELPDLLWYHLRVVFGLLLLIAMAMSFGNRSPRTKAWMMVVTSSADTISVATMQRTIVRVLLTMLVATSEYLIVAMAAPVIGKV